MGLVTPVGESVTNLDELVLNVPLDGAQIKAGSVTATQLSAAVAAAAAAGQILVGKIHITGVTGHAAGGGGSFALPAGAIILGDHVTVNVTTPATGTALLDIGYTATTAGTLSDTLVDGLDVHTAGGIFTQSDQAGANGKKRVVGASGKWVTVSAQDVSSDLTGLVADVYIPYFFS